VLHSKVGLTQASQICFTSRDSLVVTLNNEYYCISLKTADLESIKSKISYGLQQLNKNIFCTMVRSKEGSKQLAEEDATNSDSLILKQNSRILQAHLCM